MERSGRSNLLYDWRLVWRAVQRLVECQGVHVRNRSWTWLCIVAASTLLPGVDHAHGETTRSATEVGEAYEITQAYETSNRTSSGSSGTSRGRNVLLERVIAARDGGLELEYDLPHRANAEERARVWQLPARIFRPSDGPMQLLNRSELEGRVDGWLARAGLTRADCNRMTFTWNAFRIECEPQSAIPMIEAMDLRLPDVREGALYHDPEAVSPGILIRKSAGPDGETFTVEMDIDPAAVRRARAESEVAVRALAQQPVTLEAALLAQAQVSISGTISVTVDTDARGMVQRRVRVIMLEIHGPDGETESRTSTETIERRGASESPVAR
jgi:hypothetical protein